MFKVETPQPATSRMKPQQLVVRKMGEKLMSLAKITLTIKRKISFLGFTQ